MLENGDRALSLLIPNGKQAKGWKGGVKLADKRSCGEASSKQIQSPQPLPYLSHLKPTDLLNS